MASSVSTVTFYGALEALLDGGRGDADLPRPGGGNRQAVGRKQPTAWLAAHKGAARGSRLTVSPRSCAVHRPRFDSLSISNEGFVRCLKTRIERLVHVNAQGFGHDMQVVDRDILIAAQDAGDEMGRQPRALMELRPPAKGLVNRPCRVFRQPHGRSGTAATSCCLNSFCPHHSKISENSWEVMPRMTYRLLDASEASGLLPMRSS